MEAKSTKTINVLTLITVWLQVRVLPGPPVISGPYWAGRMFGITAPETPCFVYGCHALATAALMLHFVPD
jgi:hypothetical protein